LEVRNYGPWKLTWHIKPVSEALARGLSGSSSFDHKRLDPQKLEQFSKKKRRRYTYREDTHTDFFLVREATAPAAAIAVRIPLND